LIGEYLALQLDGKGDASASEVFREWSAQSASTSPLRSALTARPMANIRRRGIIHEFKTPRTSDRRHAANAKDLNEFVAALTMGGTRELRSRQIIGPISIPGEPLFKVPVLFYMGKAMTMRR
jgi:hypothetical protein